MSVVDTEVGDVVSAATVSSTLKENAIIDDHTQVEYDEEYQNSQHDVTKNLVRQVVHSREGTLEYKEKPTEDVEDELVHYVLDLYYLPALLPIRQKQPEHENARGNHDLKTPVCDFATKDKQGSQSYAPRQE